MLKAYSLTVHVYNAIFFAFFLRLQLYLLLHSVTFTILLILLNVPFSNFTPLFNHLSYVTLLFSHLSFVKQTPIIMIYTNMQ